MVLLSMIIESKTIVGDSGDLELKFKVTVSVGLNTI